MKQGHGYHEQGEKAPASMHPAEKARLDLDIPNWQIVDRPDWSKTNGVVIDTGKRIMAYNKKHFWIRYAGTKTASVIYVWAFQKERGAQA